jgi:peptidoglycan hydrolase CwlO-like protein
LSRNPENTEEDFSKYKDDKDMAEVLNRIRKDKLAPDEFVYVSDLYNYDIYMSRMQEEFKETMKRKEKRLAKAEQKIEQAEQKIEQAEQKIEQAEQKIEQAEQKIEQAEQKIEQAEQKAELSQNLLLKSIRLLLNQGGTINSIAESLGISVGEATKLAGQVQDS